MDPVVHPKGGSASIFLKGRLRLSCLFCRHHLTVDQADFKLVVSLLPLPLSAGIAGLDHHVQLALLFKITFMATAAKFLMMDD